MVELHAIFSGKVQKVGFRWAVLDAAEKFSLTGTVKNLANGKVEVIAQGTQENLELFIETLRQETGAIRVESVAVTYRVPDSLFSEFRIIH